MKTTFRIILAVLLAALTLCSCTESNVFTADELLAAEREDAAKAFDYSLGAEPPSAYNTYSAAVTELALKLFRAKAAAENGDFVFCPASAAVELSALTNAITGSAKQELLLAFGGELSADYLNQCSMYFKSRLAYVSKADGSKDAEDEEAIELPQAILADKDINIKTAFLQTMANSYCNFSVYRYDFAGGSAEKKLNRFFEKYTEDAAFSPEQGTLALASASYIRDSWLDGYAKQDIVKGSFNGTETDFLRSNESLMKSSSAAGVIKYTEKNPLKLLLIMPNKGTSLAEYIKRLDSSEYAALLDSVDITKKCTAEIPEFSVKSDGKAKSLKAEMEQCGMYTLFSEDANFSALSFTENLRLGDAVEIEPSFTLNSAGINNADSLSLSESTVTETEETIRFERPFLFMLIDNESGIPVYMGTVNG